MTADRYSYQELTLGTPHIADLLGAVSNAGSGIHNQLYRGHADKDWTLIPGLYRKDISWDSTVYRDGTPPKHYESSDWLETLFHDRFFRKAMPFGVKPSGNMIFDLCMMQHYGIPTRLLDWSADPLVSLFFAVGSQSQTDAAIYTISGAQALPMSFLTSERPKVGEFGQICSLEAPLFDMRVGAQKSYFTIQPLLTKDNEYLPLEGRDMIHHVNIGGGGMSSRGQLTSMKKIIIPLKMKYNLLAELLSIGVDKSVLFPGLQGVGDSITEAQKNNLLPMSTFK